MNDKDRFDRNYSVCQTFSMPTWMTYLSVWINTNVSNAYWPEMVCEYAWMISRIHLLSDEKMNRLDYECRMIAVEEAKSHVAESEDDIFHIMNDMILLLKKVSEGNEVSEKEWDVVLHAACVAAEKSDRHWTFPMQYAAIWSAIWAGSKATGAEVTESAESALWASSSLETERELAADRMVKKMLFAFRREIEIELVS